LNYSSWNFVTGLSGRADFFNSIKLSKEFDKNGNYIKTWCPELRNVYNGYIHDPWNMPLIMQKKLGVLIGVHYPKVLGH